LIPAGVYYGVVRPDCGAGPGGLPGAVPGPLHTHRVMTDGVPALPDDVRRVLVVGDLDGTLGGPLVEVLGPRPPTPASRPAGTAASPLPE
jgi:hypothetical protein